MDNENELPDSEELDQEAEPVEETSNEADASALEEKNRQLFERAKKAETELKELKSQPKPEVPEQEEVGVDTSKRIENLEFLEKKRQFGHEHNLSPDEADAVFRINQSPSKETLDDPFVKGGIEAIRKSRTVKANTPSTSSKSAKIDMVKMKEMNPDQRQAEFDKRQQDRQARR